VTLIVISALLFHYFTAHWHCRRYEKFYKKRQITAKEVYCAPVEKMKTKSLQMADIHSREHRFTFSYVS
jgi:hypothetical protein